MKAEIELKVGDFVWLVCGPSREKLPITKVSYTHWTVEESCRNRRIPMKAESYDKPFTRYLRENYGHPTIVYLSENVYLNACWFSDNFWRITREVQDCKDIETLRRIDAVLTEFKERAK